MSHPVKQHVDRFTRYYTAHSCTQIAVLSLLAAVNGFVWCWPPSNTWFLVSMWGSSPNGILIGSSVFLDSQAWAQTDWPRCSVCSNRPKSKMTCMFRPVHQVAAPGAKSAVSGCILLNLCLSQCLFVFCNALHHWLGDRNATVCKKLCQSSQRFLLACMHVSFCCVCVRFSVLSQQIGREERLQNDLYFLSGGT